MLFQSIDFLLFFPVVALVYFPLPRKLRPAWLLLASYFFYLSWDVRFFLPLAYCTLVTYAAGLLIERTAAGRGRRTLLILAFAACLAVLALLKYFNFAVDTVVAVAAAAGISLARPSFSILLPVGISFYLLQALGYVADVYRGKVAAERNLLRYALFVAFFPQVVSGPIGRADSLLPQMRGGQGEWGMDAPFDFDRMRRGLLLMGWGYFLKLVAADRLGLLVDTVFPAYQDYNGLHLALAAVCFSIQLYCDFAGYSAVAIGAAQVLGFALMENFKQPYLALSIRDFWRRWHVSLSSWFRDYLYIPLGGSRRGVLRTRVNTMITFLVSGLWHGASWHFVVWGGLHGLYQVIGDLLKPVRDRLVSALRINREGGLCRFVRGVFTFALVTVAWVFFRADSTRAALGFLWRMATHLTLSLDGVTGLGLDKKDLIVALAAVLVVFLADLLQRRCGVREKILALPLPVRWVVYYALIFSILIFGIYGGEYDASQFIYAAQF